MILSLKNKTNLLAMLINEDDWTNESQISQITLVYILGSFTLVYILGSLQAHCQPWMQTHALLALPFHII